MFNKIKNNQEKLNKKQEEKDAARAAECRKAVEAVLESYNVELQPYLIYHPTGVYPDVQFYPRPDKPNEPGQPQVPQAEPHPQKEPKDLPAKPRGKRTRPKLSPKQALFVQFYTDQKSETFGNATKSALRAGYGPEYARKITAVLSENVSVSMADALERQGMTDEVLAAKHAELLNKREVVFVREGKDSHHELTEQPDTNAVSKALDMAYKLKGSYAPEKHELTPGSVIFTRATDGEPRPDNPTQDAPR